jgi:LPS sulfotransferase NodH
MVYDTQQIHRELIQSAYRDYQQVYIDFKKLHPEYFYYMKHSRELTDEMKSMLHEVSVKHKHAKQRVIENILTYSKNYPEERISRYPHLKIYHVNPTFLENSVTDAVKWLNK